MNYHVKIRKAYSNEDVFYYNDLLMLKPNECPQPMYLHADFEEISFTSNIKP